MARLRKAGRIWRKPEARFAASRVTVADDGTVFTVDPLAIFGREAPLEVELGAGRGEFIAGYAGRFPEHNFLAVEYAPAVARMLGVRCGRSCLGNLRVIRMDARTLVNLLLPDRAVSAYHIYFPDPWPKERQLKHRLFTPFFIANLRRTLNENGRVFIATDVADYAESILAMMESGGFSRTPEGVPGADCTGFARKFLAQQKAVYAGSFVAPPRG